MMFVNHDTSDMGWDELYRSWSPTVDWSQVCWNMKDMGPRTRVF